MKYILLVIGTMAIIASCNTKGIVEINLNSNKIDYKIIKHIFMTDKSDFYAKYKNNITNYTKCSFECNDLIDVEALLFEGNHKLIFYGKKNKKINGISIENDFLSLYGEINNFFLLDGKVSLGDKLAKVMEEYKEGTLSYGDSGSLSYLYINYNTTNNIDNMKIRTIFIFSTETVFEQVVNYGKSYLDKIENIKDVKLYDIYIYKL